MVRIKGFAGWLGFNRYMYLKAEGRYYGNWIFVKKMKSIFRYFFILFILSSGPSWFRNYQSKKNEAQPEMQPDNTHSKALPFIKFRACRNSSGPNSSFQWVSIWLSVEVSEPGWAGLMDLQDGWGGNRHMYLKAEGRYYGNWIFVKKMKSIFRYFFILFILSSGPSWFRNYQSQKKRDTTTNAAG